MSDAYAAPAAAPSAERAAARPLLAVFATLLAVGLPEVGLALVRLPEMDAAVATAFASYDAQYDPIRIEGGRVTAAGPRVPDLRDGTTWILVDPGYTVSDDDLEAFGGQYAVLREDRFVQKRGFKREEIRLADVQGGFLPDPLVIDGPGLTALWASWRTPFLALVAVILAVMMAMSVVGLVIQAAIVGPLLRAVSGRGGTLFGSFWTALLAAAGPQLLVRVFALTVWDPGFFLRSFLILMLSLPLTFVLLPSKSSG